MSSFVVGGDCGGGDDILWASRTDRGQGRATNEALISVRALAGSEERAIGSCAVSWFGRIAEWDEDLLDFLKLCLYTLSAPH